MIYFHCDIRTLHDQETLITALQKVGLRVRADSQFLAIGSLEEGEFCIRAHPKRFRTNLSVTKYPSLLPIMRASPLFVKVVKALEGLGIISVGFPVGEELEYARNSYGGDASISEKIREVIQCQESVERFVANQDFINAKRFAVERELLLNQLWELGEQAERRVDKGG